MRLPALCCVAFSSLALPVVAEAQLASMVSDIRTSAEAGGSAPLFLGSASGTTYFTALSTTVQRTLWSTDGTPEGTRAMPDGCSGACGEHYRALGQAEDRLFMAITTYSDGGYANALLLASGSPPTVAPVLLASSTLSISDLARPGRTALLEGNLLFSARAAPDAVELYATEGSAGTYNLLGRFESTSALAGMQRAGAVVYFWNYPYTSPPELWSTDGTPSGTRRIAALDLNLAGEIRIGTEGGHLLFAARDSNGSEVWSSDGSPDGTRRLTDFADPDARIWHMAASPTRVFFYVEDVTFGQEIWSTDGTPEGTRPLTSFGYYEPFGDDYSTNQLVAAGNRAYFLATTGLQGVQLWVSDESGSAASPIAQVCSDAGCFYYQWLRAIGSQVFFLGFDSEHGDEVWTTDGRTSGTHLLSDACPGVCGAFGTVLTTAGGRLVYSAPQAGVSASTVYVAAAPWVDSVSLYDAVRSAPTTDPYAAVTGADDGELLYFGGRDSTGGVEPWVSAGNPATTFQLADIAGPQDAGSYPRAFSALDGILAFRASDSYDQQFWLTDGSRVGTRRATTDFALCGDPETPIEPLGSRFASLGCQGQVLMIDPVANQTTAIPTTDCSYPIGFGVVNETVAAAFGCGPSSEIWRSDGTVGGTSLALALPDGFDVNSAFHLVNGRLLLVGGSETTRLYALSTSMSSLQPLTDSGVYPESVIAPRGEGLGFFSQTSRVWRTDGTSDGTFPIGPSPPTLGCTCGELSDRLPATTFWCRPPPIAWRSGPRTGRRRERSSEPALHPIPPPGGPSRWTGPGAASTSSSTPIRKDRPFGSSPMGRQSPCNCMPLHPRRHRERALVHRADREYFTACDSEHGCELWMTEGTIASTRLVHDIAPGSQSSTPTELVTVRDRVYFAADDGQHGFELWALPLDDGPACRTNDLTLCLENQRFQVSARWTDFAGRSGDATAVPITGDTGYFWFFDEDNVELILKLIDGTGYNGHHWVYYGALSNVEYTFTVTDSETGAAKRYFNPATRFASSGDITAFGPNGAHAAGGPAEAMTRAARPPEVSLAALSAPQGLPGACVPSATRLLHPQ